jgi:cob(I)alamin adenosyltransferase
MKIYTKTGDTGTTGLVGGDRTSKANLRIEAIGTIDELNCQLGVALATSPPADIGATLQTIQNWLFDIGSELACPPAGKYQLKSVTEKETAKLEAQIDLADQELPPLSQFILPGGCAQSAQLHLCRAISRRAERVLVALHQQNAVNPELLVFVNRLSDWLFCMARLCNYRSGTVDIPWTKIEL